ETEVNLIYEAWQRLPEPQRVEVERTFRVIDEMACEAGVKALVEEGQFQGVDLAGELEALKGHHSKAMWAYLRHQEVFDLASLFNYVESLSTRYWLHVIQLPRKAPDVSPESICKLQNALSYYFKHREGRGQRCTVEPYLRGESLHYFFAYPDDYAETYI